MKHFFIIFFLIATATISAQSTLRGRVTDAKMQGIPYVQIGLTISDSLYVKEVSADENGRFEIRDVPAGNFTLSARNIGYLVKTIPVQVRSADVELQTIELTEESQLLNEVTIAAKKPAAYEFLADRTVINVQRSPTATGSTALEILAQAPNLNVDRANSNIALNGKTGVIVMIDGKPTRMDNAALIQYLSSISGSAIKKIELISTPPSSFDASGSAGVVNIEMLKNNAEGWSGAINGNGGYGAKGKFGSGFDLNWRKNKTSIFSSFSTSNSYTDESLKTTNINRNGNQLLGTDVSSSRPAFLALNNAKIGLDYEVSDRFSIGMLSTLFNSVWDLDAQTITKYTTDGLPSGSSKLSSAERNVWYNWFANLNMQYKLGESEKFTFDFDYLHNKGTDPTDYHNEIFDADENFTKAETFISRKKTPIAFYVSRLDYTKKTGNKIAFNAGVKVTNSAFKNHVSVATSQDHVFVNDPAFTDTATLNEQIYAGYASVDYNLGLKTVISGGLRYEHTSTKLTSITTPDLKERKYGKLFPTATFSHEFENELRLQFAYTERIGRPSFNNLAPSFFFFGPNVVVSGNPALKPVESKVITSSIAYKSVLLTAQLNFDKNPISLWQPATDAQQNFVVNRPENLNQSTLHMLSANYKKALGWWTMQLTVSGFTQRLTFQKDAQKVSRSDQFATLNTAHTFKINKTTAFEVSNQSWTKRYFGLGVQSAKTTFNIAVQKKIGQGHQFTIAWNDVGNLGTFWEIKYNEPKLNLNNYFFYENEGSVVRINYTYRFGTPGNKVRQSASDEEKSRL